MASGNTGTTVYNFPTRNDPTEPPDDPGQRMAVRVIDETEDGEGKNSQDKESRRIREPDEKGEILTPTEKPSKLKSFKRLCRLLYKRFGMKHMITLFMVIIYTVIGAAIFIALEKEVDKKNLDKAYSDYQADRLKFAGNFSRLIRRAIQNGGVNNLQKLIDDQLRLYDQTRGTIPDTGESTVWNFWNAMYFAGTIYTTIGYGDMYCTTTSGRIFTMFYSLIGIPLMLITLTDMGGVLLKMMLSMSRCWDNCKANYSPTALLGPHPPTIYQKPPTMVVRQNETGEETKQMELMESGKRMDDEDDVEDVYELEKREDEVYETYLEKISVFTALFVTVGWIFICAGLFCIWEDWNYFTSVYFFFISLSTIGLGDETPNRKDIMVATYVFVIIGLSLVSMCITVIQKRLEDLYLYLLQMMLQEYQKRLMSGDDQIGATVGMMQAWQKSFKAKLLMPLLGKDKKKTVAKKFQDEAKARGIVLPAVLRDLDPKTGIPSVLRAMENKMTEGVSQMREAAAGAIQRAVEKAKTLHEPVEDNLPVQTVQELQQEEEEEAEEEEEESFVEPPPPPPPPPPPVCYDADAQTDELEMEDKQEQTIMTTQMDAQTQSVQSSFASGLRVDGTSQTPTIETDDAYAQCQIEEEKEMAPKPDSAEEQIQTDAIDTTEACSQTSKVTNREQEIQTRLIDLMENESQTEILETKNQRLQTPIPEIMEQEAQTDPLVLDPELFQMTGTLSMASNKKGWAKAKENLQQAIKKAKTGMHTTSSKSKMPTGGLPTVSSLAGMEESPAMANWSDVVGDDERQLAGSSGVKFYGGDYNEEFGFEEMPKLRKVSKRDSKRGSQESLHWDPFDGLHAEPQKKVGDLKQKFEVPKKGEMGAKRKQLKK